MSANLTGLQTRLYPWQVKHYITHGGPNDPVAQATGGPPVTGAGVLSWNSTLTLPPLPGTQTPPNVPLPRVQSLNSGGTLTVTTAVMATSTGGIYVGTIPGGAWIDDVEIYCYAALAGGTSTSVGLFYAPAGSFSASNSPGFQPATLWTLGYITTPAAGTVYGTRTRPANATTSAGMLGSALTGYQVGPGNGVSGAQQGANLGPPTGEGFGGAKDLLAGGAQPTQGDIDLYFCSFLIAGGGTAPTGGSFAFRVDFSGLVG